MNLFPPTLNFSLGLRRKKGRRERQEDIRDGRKGGRGMKVKEKEKE